MSNPSDRLKEPLKLFVKELGNHLELLDKILGESPTQSEHLELARKRLESRFHLMKGSAGFFALKSISEISSHGEDAMKKAKGDNDAIVAFLKQELPRVISKLRTEFKVLEEQYLS